jgi:hypothetical protein
MLCLKLLWFPSGSSFSGLGIWFICVTGKCERTVLLFSSFAFAEKNGFADVGID